MFSQIFIERPKLAMVVSIVTVIAGLICLREAPIAEYPEIAPPTVMVMANYDGASSQEVADSVASVIEEQINGLENLLYFSSTSSNTGSYLLEITFESGSNTDINLVNVQNAVKRAEPLLPESVQRTGVKMFKRNSDILSFYNFTTDGSKLTLTELSNFIRTNVRDPLARIPGVSEVSIMGERNYSMRLWLDTDKMDRMGISIDVISAAVRSQNIQAAAGSVPRTFRPPPVPSVPKAAASICSSKSPRWAVSIPPRNSATSSSVPMTPPAWSNSATSPGSTSARKVTPTNPVSTVKMPSR